MIQSLLRSMELLEVLKEKNRNFSIAELAEAIPPVYTEFIGKQIIDYIERGRRNEHRGTPETN